MKQKNHITKTDGRKVKDYSQEPLFIKKAKETKAFVDKHGLPKELVVKKRG